MLILIFRYFLTIATTLSSLGLHEQCPDWVGKSPCLSLTTLQELPQLSRRPGVANFLAEITNNGLGELRCLWEVTAVKTTLHHTRTYELISTNFRLRLLQDFRIEMLHDLKTHTAFFLLILRIHRAFLPQYNSFKGRFSYCLLTFSGKPQSLGDHASVQPDMRASSVIRGSRYHSQHPTKRDFPYC